MRVEVNDGKVIHVFTQHTNLGDVLAVVPEADRNFIAQSAGYTNFDAWTKARTGCAPDEVDHYPQRRETFMIFFLSFLRLHMRSIENKIIRLD